MAKRESPLHFRPSGGLTKKEVETYAKKKYGSINEYINVLIKKDLKWKPKQK